MLDKHHHYCKITRRLGAVKFQISLEKAPCDSTRLLSLDITSASIRARPHEHIITPSAADLPPPPHSHMALVRTFTLPHYEAYPVHIALFKDVKNAVYLRSQLLEANAAFDYAFLDAQMVRPIQLLP